MDNPLINLAGRPRVFETEEDFQIAAMEYFKWNEENPYLREKSFASEGKILVHEEKVMRPLTIEGFCIYCGIARSTFYEYCEKPQFSDITTRVRDLIENYQFSGAASGFFNANIIARKLGLSEKSETRIIEDQPIFPEDNQTEN